MDTDPILMYQSSTEATEHYHNPYAVSAETNWYFNLINHAIIGQILSWFGIVTNLINIIVFIKMGFKDPINISLLGLSISDFLSCLSLPWMNLTKTAGFIDLDLPFEPFGTGYLTGSWPHFIFVRITSCITAFIVFERCLCVVFPLKVKELITRKRVAIATVSIYLFVLGLTVVMFYSYRLEGVFYPERNKTITSLVIVADNDAIEMATFTMSGVILPFSVFFLTIVFTVVLVVVLNKNAKWRNQATTASQGAAPSSSNQSQSSSSRDVKVARMVILISTLFIICFAPIMVSTMCIVAVPILRSVDPEANVMFAVFSIIYILETVNASLNIVIYYKRSSNYKATFDRVFRRNNTEGKKDVIKGK